MYDILKGISGVPKKIARKILQKEIKQYEITIKKLKCQNKNYSKLLKDDSNFDIEKLRNKYKILELEIDALKYNRITEKINLFPITQPVNCRPIDDNRCTYY